jgi:nuclear pore complex protein Nup107
MWQREEWLENERNTWRLVYCLYQNRVSSHLLSPEEQLNEEVMDIPLRQRSEKEVVQQLYKDDNITREVSLFFNKECSDTDPYL